MLSERKEDLFDTVCRLASEQNVEGLSYYIQKKEPSFGYQGLTKAAYMMSSSHSYIFGFEQGIFGGMSESITAHISPLIFTTSATGYIFSSFDKIEKEFKSSLNQVCNNTIKSVKTTIERKTSVNSIHKYNHTPVSFLALQGDSDAVKLLIKYFDGDRHAAIAGFVQGNHPALGFQITEDQTKRIQFALSCSVKELEEQKPTADEYKDIVCGLKLGGHLETPQITLRTICLFDLSNHGFLGTELQKQMYTFFEMSDLFEQARMVDHLKKENKLTLNQALAWMLPEVKGLLLLMLDTNLFATPELNLILGYITELDYKEASVLGKSMIQDLTNLRSSLAPTSRLGLFKQGAEFALGKTVSVIRYLGY